MQRQLRAARLARLEVFAEHGQPAAAQPPGGADRQHAVGRLGGVAAVVAQPAALRRTGILRLRGAVGEHYQLVPAGRRVRLLQPPAQPFLGQQPLHEGQQEAYATALDHTSAAQFVRRCHCTGTQISDRLRSRVSA